MSRTLFPLAVFFLTVFFIQLSRSTQAQPTNAKGWYQQEDIQNTDIGWMKMLEFKEPPKPLAQHGRNYPVKQIEHMRKIGSWLQQTYTPRGFLGEMKLSVLAPEPSYPPTSKYYGSNEAEKHNRNALPNTYGAFAKLYMFLKKTPEKRFWPIDGLADYYTWYVMANNISLISKQMISLSSADEYYFTMPKYSTDTKGVYESEWNEQGANYRNFTSSPGLQRYEHFMVPAKALDPGPAKYVVILTKDRKPLPFDHVTVGQLISRLEAQLPMLHTLATNNGTRTENLHERADKGFRILKEMYKHQLDEYVYISDMNREIDLLCLYEIESSKKVYWLKTEPVTKSKEGHLSSNFPLLKLRKGVKEACANGDPQWIVCRMEKGDPEKEGEVYKMETFINRFNYDYVYEYFFGKEKVIRPYKPLVFGGGSSTAKSTTDLPQSAAAKNKKSDPSILFFEDFSTVATGAAPQNWTTQRSAISGDQVAVTELNGATGKWLRLKRNASPKNIAFPVAGDVELTFDLLVHKGDVPWGTTSIETQLFFSSGQGEKEYALKVTPGDMNRTSAAGWMSLNLAHAPCNLENYYSVADFTGSKPVNKVTMIFRKKGTSLIVLCNNHKMYECSTAFSGDMQLKKLNFYVNEMNVYYLSNIQLKRLN